MPEPACVTGRRHVWDIVSQVTLGTVPGTVPEVVPTVTVMVTWMPILSPTCGVVRTANETATLKPILEFTVAATPAEVLGARDRATRGVIHFGTWKVVCRAISAATSEVTPQAFA